MQYMIDLYSGLGGASEAFIQDPGWQVWRFENNPLLAEVPGTLLVDAKEVNPAQLRSNTSWELLWASPPCREFSLGFAAPGPTAAREGIEFEPDLTLVELALEWDRILKPKFLVIENVKGAKRHFAKLGLYPVQCIGSFVLYGRFPRIIMPDGFHHQKETTKFGKGHDTWSTDPLRANKKAKIPLELSLALKQAIEQQTTLGLWTV